MCVRRALRSLLHRLAGSCGVGVAIEEDRGWFSSIFDVRVTGSRDAVGRFVQYWDALDWSDG